MFVRPGPFLALVSAGIACWLERQAAARIEYLKAENRALRTRLSRRRIIFTDAERQGKPHTFDRILDRDEDIDEYEECIDPLFKVLLDEFRQRPQRCVRAACVQVVATHLKSVERLKGQFAHALFCLRMHMGPIACTYQQGASLLVGVPEMPIVLAHS